VTISGDYPRPVSVNGYQCWNCHEVAEAKKGINPAPQPQGASSRDNASSPAVVFGGALAGAPTATSPSGASAASPASATPSAPASLDILV